MPARASWKFPGKAAPLFVPAPYKVMYGGRGGAKSWAAARALLHLATQRKLFILCAREIQKSISESVYKLLVDQIDAMGLAHVFDIKFASIINTETGSRFVFAGVRNNITAIKSMEAIDICWVEEAEKVSGYSWGVLLPTIRRDPPHGPFGRGSEVWVVFNPELERDFTYQYWAVSPPQPCHRFTIGEDGDVQAALRALKAQKPTTVLMEMNWHDNEWFPEILRKQMEDLKKRDYESYLTVWEGKVRRVIQGAIYAKEIERAQREGRISGMVEVDRSKPVDIGVDLGRADMTTLWFMQQVGMQHHAIDYYGNFGFDWTHYLEQIQERRYVIGRIYLPHDARNKHVDAKKSVYQQTRDAYPGDGRVQVVPRTQSVVNDINAVRMLFPRLHFNEKLCADGLHGLAHYQYEVDPEDHRDISDAPLHNWASHPADGLRSYVMGLKDDSTRGRPQMHIPAPPPQNEGLGHGWMAR
jgi:phage terminase large subunit